jgi:hypothetical protein
MSCTCAAQRSAAGARACACMCARACAGTRAATPCVVTLLPCTPIHARAHTHTHTHAHTHSHTHTHTHTLPHDTHPHLHEAVPERVGALLVLAAHAVPQQLLAAGVHVALADDSGVDAVVRPRALRARPAGAVCVRACVRACACARVCMRACVRARMKQGAHGRGWYVGCLLLSVVSSPCTRGVLTSTAMRGLYAVRLSSRMTCGCAQRATRQR